MLRMLLAAVLLAGCATTAPVAPTPMAPAPTPVSAPAEVTTDIGGNVLHVSVSDDNNYLILHTEITHQTDDAVLSALFEDPTIDMVVLLDNAGGYVVPAQAIGWQLRKFSIGTVIDGYCESACVDIFVAGTLRAARSNAEIGLHAPDMIYDEGIEVDRRYYTAMGVPQMMVSYSIPNSDMMYMSGSEAVTYGIAHVTF